MTENPFGPPLTLPEVARALRVSTRTVRRMVKEGHFSRPAHTPGGRPVWFARDVEVYLYLLARGHFAPGPIPEIEEGDD